MIFKLLFHCNILNICNNNICTVNFISIVNYCSCDNFNVLIRVQTTFRLP